MSCPVFDSLVSENAFEIRIAVDAFIHATKLGFSQVTYVHTVAATGGETVAGIGTIISYLATPPEETVKKLNRFLNLAE